MPYLVPMIPSIHFENVKMLLNISIGSIQMKVGLDNICIHTIVESIPSGSCVWKHWESQLNLVPTRVVQVNRKLICAMQMRCPPLTT